MANIRYVQRNIIKGRSNKYFGSQGEIMEFTMDISLMDVLCALSNATFFLGVPKK